MTKFQLVLQKVTVVALVVASLPTVIPFLLLFADMLINKDDSIFLGMMDFLYVTLDEINED